jgi:hypothetical protein
VIKARLDDTTDQLHRELALTYVNNSPDTLRLRVLPPLPGGVRARIVFGCQGRRTARPRRANRYAGTRIRFVAEDGIPLRLEQDNTVLKVWLKQAAATERTHHLPHRLHHPLDHGCVPAHEALQAAGDGKHYDGVHWYPRIAVYDERFGWDTQQHLGSEFYGDFGTFDVDLDFPHHYVLDATGWLQNENEVLPPDLKAKLAIANFKDKPWNEAPSVIIAPEPGKRKVWKFHAENVHDFAFTADPNYRIGEAEWKRHQMRGPGARTACQRMAERCQNTRRRSSLATAATSAMYAYPKMIVADARDGMEYPMLTLDGGNDPDYRGLLAHEVGHNWFFGMVGNNETYRAFLDEGFTQFLTAWGLGAHRWGHRCDRTTNYPLRARDTRPHDREKRSVLRLPTRCGA